MSGVSVSGRDGSKLCLQCGLCCQGVFHDWVRLHPGEASAARRLGLQVSGQGTAFALPCGRHRDGRCSIYTERLGSCRTYRCKLLRRYTRGEIDLEAGLAAVARVRALVARIRQRLGSDGCERSLWHELRERRNGRATTTESAELLLDVASLHALSNRHFKNRPDEVAS